MKYINERLEKLDKEKMHYFKNTKLTLENSKNISLNALFEKIDNWKSRPRRKEASM